jgi:predicted RNase H-like HicB family nuclease
MRTFNIVVERDPDTGLYVGYVPGWSGAHSQGATLDELQANLREVLELLLEDGDPKLESRNLGEIARELFGEEHGVDLKLPHRELPRPVGFDG